MDFWSHWHFVDQWWSFMVKHPLFKASWEREELCLDDPGGELIYEHGTLQFVLFHGSMMLSCFYHVVNVAFHQTKCCRCRIPQLLFFSHAVPSKAFWDTPKSNVWNQDRWTRKLLGHSVEFVYRERRKDFPVWISFHNSSTQVDMDFYRMDLYATDGLRMVDS